MADSASLIASARQRFSDINTDMLREMWSNDGRAEWAETALRLELLDRGAHAHELDAVAGRRADIAANAPPKARDTLWKYGVVGRGLVLGGVVGWCLGMRAFGGSASIAYIGSLAVLGYYVYVLTRRTVAQAHHESGIAASFLTQWQLIEAWFVLIGTAVVALVYFFA